MPWNVNLLTCKARLLAGKLSSVFSAFSYKTNEFKNSFGQV